MRSTASSPRERCGGRAEQRAFVRRAANGIAAFGADRPIAKRHGKTGMIQLRSAVQEPAQEPDEPAPRQYPRP